ncbi:MAG: hypothetical protein H2057_02170 [Alphaproteobacteria bacterium]|nr:hypothetical protein [Alphaproteobacteria bacterium]
MKTPSLLKTALSLLFFTATTCPAAFGETLDVDISPLQVTPTVSSTNTLGLKEVSTTSKHNFG